MGYAISMALGKRVSPLPGCMEDREPLAPCISAFKLFPLFSGDLGGPCLLPPLLSSLPHAAMFLCCQIGCHSPSSALGVGARFLLPHALDCPHPQSGNSGHQVPCIEPSLLVSFSQI